MCKIWATIDVTEKITLLWDKNRFFVHDGTHDDVINSKPKTKLSQVGFCWARATSWIRPKTSNSLWNLL